jgi:membrane-associated phospholipid phosphatase
MCLLLALTGGQAGPVDRHVFDMVINHRGQFLIDVATSFVALGEAVPLLVICLLWGAVVVVPFGGERQRWTKQQWARASVPLLVLISTAVVVAVLKQVIGRVGPAEVLRSSWGHSLAFPSGHSALSAGVLFAIAVLLATDSDLALRTRLVIIGVALGTALMVSFSTVVLFMHWPSDALGGTAIGVLIAALVLAVADRSMGGAAEAPISGT